MNLKLLYQYCSGKFFVKIINTFGFKGVTHRHKIHYDAKCSVLKDAPAALLPSWELKINISSYIKFFFTAVLGGLTACSGTNVYENDPFEKVNRQVHQLNLVLDRNFVRPISLSYVAVVNEDIREAVSNVSENLSVPGDVVNNLLQGDFKSAIKNTGKFVINLTLGVGGIGKPAEHFGITGKEGDFGETLHVWGSKEGPFIVIPIFGPSTGRDAVGVLGDLALDPLGPVLTEQARIFAYGVRMADVMGKRGIYANSVDSILYDSADSYEHMKIIFLQARRFELDGANEDDYFDPYDELFPD